MATAREPVRFNAQDSNEQTINKLNRLVDELTTRLATAELRLTQGFQLLKAPTAGYALICDADGNGSWGAVATEETEPGGSTTQVQFNDAGAFGGDAGMTYAKATDTLTLAGNLGCAEVVAANVDLSGTFEAEGQVTLQGDVVFTNVEASILVGASRYFIIKPTARVPANATATGTQGEFRIDGTHIHYCVSTNVWKRALLSTW